MGSTLAPLAAPIIGVTFVLAGSGLFNSVTSFRFGVAQMSASVAGIVLSGYFLGLIVGSLRCPKIVGRIGHIRAFAAFCALAAGSVLVHGLWVEPAAWFFLRGLVGFGTAGIYIVAESWLNEKVTPLNRGLVLSMYTAACQIGLTVGQSLLAFVDSAASSAFTVAGLFLVFAVVPVTTTRAPQPHVHASERMPFRRLIAIAPLGTVTCFLAGAANNSVFAVGPMVGSGLGLSQEQTAWFMSAVVFGGMCSQWPMGRLSDRVRRGWVIALCAGSLAVVCIALRSFWMPGMVAIGGGFCIGFFLFVLYPVAIAYVNDVLSPEQILSASSALILVYSVGAASGPIATSFFVDLLGPYGLFYVLAVVGLILVPGSLVVMHYRDPVAQSDKEAFLPTALPQTAPMADLDPRLSAAGEVEAPAVEA